MRLLFFVQGKTVEDQVGFDDAFQTILAEGEISAYKAVPWLGIVREQGWDSFFAKAKICVDEFQPDVIYFQFFHEKNGPDVTAFFESLRKTASRPLIVISAGDAFSGSDYYGRKYPKGFLSAARLADATFVTALGRGADYLVKKGVSNIVLLPLGACQVRFKPQEIEVSKYKPEFDVVFVGSVAGSFQNHPLSFSFYSDLKRTVMVHALQKRYGKRFGLFGNGWKGMSSWQGPIPFAEQVEVCRNSQVIFGGCSGVYQDYYASDRPFIQGVSGIPLVDWAVPRTDKLLRDQDHWYLVNDEKSMIRQIDQLLKNDVEERLAKGAKTADYIYENLSQLALMRFFVRTIASFREGKQNGRCARLPEFDFFLPEVDARNEALFAQQNWI